MQFLLKLLAILLLALTLLLPTMLESEKSTITVASWNIQKLGPKKLSNAAIMNKVAKQLSQFDVIIIQEINNKGEQDDCSTCTACNLAKNILETHLSRYSNHSEILVSPQIRDERFAVVLNNPSISIRSSWMLSASSCNRTQPLEGMRRPPWVVDLTTINLSLASIHTSPSYIDQDFSELNSFIDQNPNIIFLGDFNTRCDSPLLSNHHITLVPTPIRTAHGVPCAIDNILIPKSLQKSIIRTGRTYIADKKISDHHIIWFEIVI
jgi:endonuclease/exonuclease/phosphatase family metal-dependent hydrolase